MSDPKPQLNFFAKRTPPGPQVYTVAELTRELKGLLEGRFRSVWVTGEVTGCRRQSSGHVYFGLKDDGAQLSAVLWRTQARNLRFDLKDGLEVLVRGRISVYEPRGQYQLVVDHVEPKGLGALQAAFEQLKARLAAEGLFDEARKRPLPRLPKKVGVVTSPTGAAIHDFLRVARRRHPHLSILIAPARVQGEGAAEEIAAQVASLDARGDCDVIVVTRGGGSIEDLWAFNEEPVARALFACRTPVVSAVGHEVDFTIADFVADVRCPTPSAAAETIAPEWRVLKRDLRALNDRLAGAIERALDRRRAGLERVWGRVDDPRRLLGDRRLALEALRERLEASLPARLRIEERRVRALRERLDRQHPRERLHRLRNEIDRLSMRLGGAVERHLGEARRRHATLAGTLDALSPLKVLERGYGLVRGSEGGVVRDAAQLKVGDRLQIDLARGRVHAEVLGTEKE